MRIVKLFLETFSIALVIPVIEPRSRKAEIVARAKAAKPSTARITMSTGNARQGGGHGHSDRYSPGSHFDCDLGISTAIRNLEDTDIMDGIRCHACF